MPSCWLGNAGCMLERNPVVAALLDDGGWLVVTLTRKSARISGAFTADSRLQPDGADGHYATPAGGLS